MVCGAKMVAYARGAREELAPPVAEGAVAQMEALYFGKLAKLDGTENPYRLWQELGQLMTTHVTVERDNAQLKRVDEELASMMTTRFPR
jgi:succinate dehydrogenase / fumarate reductase flavoprotein subunit